MKTRFIGIVVAVFVLGVTAGAYAAKKGLDPATYQGKSKKEAAAALLELSKKQAEKGSWENIAVGRIYYAGGMKSEGQAIFDSITNSKKVEASDWIRVGRAYYDAGDWAKAKVAFDKALSMKKKDAPWLAEVGAYYNLKGDRAKAEEYFERSLKIEQDVWNSADMAGSYIGVTPLR